MSTIINNYFAVKTASAELVPAVTAERIKVCALILSADAAATIKLKTDNGSGADISPVFNLAANSNLVVPFDYEGWYETGAGEALYAVITGTVNLSITIKYRTGV